MLARTTGTSALRRSRRWAASVVGLVLAATLTGCTVEAGSALVLDGSTFSDQSIQHDSSAFIATNATAAVSTAQTASVNRAQITFRVRHALIAKAIAAQGITEAQITQAGATVSAQGGATSTNVAAQLNLPATEEADALHDAVALEALIKTIPAAGTPVQNVSVTAEGVPAANRDAAVALRTKFLADPAAMDAAVIAAPSASNPVPKDTYKLITAPGAGAAGLFQPSSGTVSIIARGTDYLVIRTTGRTVQSTPLLQSDFSQLTALSQLFDLGALLLVPYEASTDIAVNPRYGVWDPASVQVVPGNDGL
jgi:hypothetical protein